MNGAVEFLDEDAGAPTAGEPGGPTTEEEGLAEADWVRRVDRVIRDRRWRFVAAGLAAATAITTFGSVAVPEPQRATGAGVESPPEGVSSPPTGELLTQYEDRVADVYRPGFHCVFLVTRPGSTAPVPVRADSGRHCLDPSHRKAMRWPASTP